MWHTYDRRMYMNPVNIHEFADMCHLSCLVCMLNIFIRCVFSVSSETAASAAGETGDISWHGSTFQSVKHLATKYHITWFTSMAMFQQNYFRPISSLTTSVTTLMTIIFKKPHCTYFKSVNDFVQSSLTSNWGLQSRWYNWRDSFAITSAKRTTFRSSIWISSDFCRSETRSGPTQSQSAPQGDTGAQPQSTKRCVCSFGSFSMKTHFTMNTCPQQVGIKT